ncbi:MAG: GTP-binding protein [Lentisphaeraceae bacterium]|nr:GTP-binding protein [Lentisphaeraceae bacterium]
MKTQSGKTPVSIITGFLGSGKTTLVNHILTANHGFKIAVIVNEFGEIGIDGDLIVKDENSILELSNGCLCCAIIGDLTQIVVDLEKSGKDFDYLLIETTGIANPAPVAEVFYFDPRINSKYFVDGIVTVVDPINLEIDIEDNEECYKQIAFADLFILNKADIVNGSQLEKSKALLKLVNPVTPYISAEYGKVPIENILQLGSKPNANILENHHEEHDDHDHKHHHSTPVESESIIIEGAMNQGKLRYWLSTLIFDRSDLIYRMKGIVNISGCDEKLIFQSVHRLFEDGNGGAWTKDEVRQTKIVFIGEKLDREELLEGLHSCLATDK